MRHHLEIVIVLAQVSSYLGGRSGWSHLYVVAAHNADLPVHNHELCMKSAENRPVIVDDFEIKVWDIFIGGNTNPTCRAVGFGDVKVVVKNLRRVSILCWAALVDLPASHCLDHK